MSGGSTPRSESSGAPGFYSFIEDAEEMVVDTPYGPTSDRFVIGDMGGKRVAFLPRHGRTHSLPPHAIPYRANLWAMKELGVRRVIGPCASGSLSKDLPPGAFVVCDQFVDRTSGRADTFYDGPVTTHVSSADPYCADLRRILLETGRGQGLDIRDGGTVVVIQGPRFSTRSESALVLRDGVGRDQHDRLPRGLAGPRAGAVLRQRLADHRLRRRSGGRPRCRAGEPRRRGQGVHRKQREAAPAAVRGDPQDRAAARGHLLDGARRARASERHEHWRPNPRVQAEDAVTIARLSPTFRSLPREFAG